MFSSKSTTSFSAKTHSDWQVIFPPFLHATAGVIIGLVIGNFLGWV